MATFVPPKPINSPVHDYHNQLADMDEQQPVGHDTTAIESAAFEKGRMQGEMEAARRFESESHHKTFVQDPAIATTAVAQPDMVIINRLTMWQWAAAILGEILSVGYIVLMAIWLSTYASGGLSWVNKDHNGSRGTFNTHVLTGFIGLWFVAQAYITYRLLPLNMPSMINRLWYTFCHAAALACFGLSVAGAVISNPESSRSWSMHAWTAYAALLVYAVHAIYSVFRVLFSRRAVGPTTWNETATHFTPDQRLANQQATYRAGPGSHLMRNRQRNLGGENAVANSNAPHWSETSFVRNQIFLVPRKKWAVTALFGLMASVLMGLAAYQMAVTTNGSVWPRSADQNSDRVNETSNHAIFIGVIGLATLLGTMLIGYAAMPPRTTIQKSVANFDNRRTSISTGTTAPHTYSQQQGVEVV
jgi:hypothetical protein